MQNGKSPKNKPFIPLQCFLAPVCGGVAQKHLLIDGVLHSSMRVLQSKGSSDVSGRGTVLHAQDRLYSVDDMEPRN